MPGFVDRLLGDLADEVAAMSFSGVRARAATRTMLATVLSILAALVLDLENPWWAGITGLVLVQKTATATWARSVDRILGTLLGAAFGYLAAITIDDHLLFQFVCLATAAFTFYGQERVEHSYAVLLGGVTVILVLFGSLERPDFALHLAYYRAFEIIVGVVIATAVDYALIDGPRLAHGPSRKPGIFALPLDRDLAATALAGGISIALIPWIWESLELPGLAQTPITAFVIVAAMRQEPARKAANRALGCALGGAFGIAAMHIVGDNLLLWLAALSIGIFASADLAHGERDVSYVGLQAGFAIILAMVQGSRASADTIAVLDRLAGIFGGIVVVALVLPMARPPIRHALDWMLRSEVAERDTVN